MNDYTRFASLLALSLCMQMASAHDPKEHAKEAAAANAGPNCAAMQDRDASKMDPNDPVMKAMMIQCSGASHHEHTGHSATSPVTTTGAKSAAPGDH